MIEEDKLNALELLGENEYLHKEIERLIAESTKWESKFYEEAKKVDKAIKYIKKTPRRGLFFDIYLPKVIAKELLDILKGVDKE